MQKNVQIIPDELGNVIRVSNNNPEYAHIRLSQSRLVVNNGFLSKKDVTTLLHGAVEDLREMGIAEMKTLPGKIVVKEQLEPFSTTNPDRDLKIAGSTGIICCVHGEPIYRKTIYTADVTAEDVLLDHTNGDAIREANGNTPIAVKKPAAVSVSKAFDIEAETKTVEPKAEESETEDIVEDTIEEVTDEVELDEAEFEL